MLTIENLDKIRNSVGFDIFITVSNTHYSFLVDVEGGKRIEITLARHKPKFQNGKPHPHKGEYLLQCHHISWKHYWVTKNDIKDIWDMTRLIESFINEVKC
jgi:hypothetical protein